MMSTDRKKPEKPRSRDTIRTTSGVRAPLSEEDKDNIVKMRLDGKTTIELADMYGRRPDAIIKVLRARGVKIPRGRPLKENEPSSEE